MTTLYAEDLVKSYRRREVVRGVSVAVDAGEVVGLLGPNGAGKTTCFYMIVGLVTADRGIIHLEDEEIGRLPMHARARRGLSYLAQEPSVFRKLTARDNLMAVFETRKDLTQQERRNRCLQSRDLILLACQRLPGTRQRCLLGGHFFILEDDVMDLQDHHLAVVPVVAVRVVADDALETFKRFPIVLMHVMGIGMDNPHLEENAVRNLGMVFDNLGVFFQG